MLDVAFELDVVDVAPDAEVEPDALEVVAEVDFVGLAQPFGTLKSWQVLQYIID